MPMLTMSVNRAPVLPRSVPACNCSAIARIRARVCCTDCLAASGACRHAGPPKSRSNGWRAARPSDRFTTSPASMASRRFAELPFVGQGEQQIERLVRQHTAAVVDLDAARGQRSLRPQPRAVATRHASSAVACKRGEPAPGGAFARQERAVGGHPGRGVEGVGGWDCKSSRHSRHSSGGTSPGMGVLLRISEARPVPILHLPSLNRLTSG